MERAIVRREIRTTSPSRSIWQPQLSEEAFRHTAVDLALATNECPIEADIGLASQPVTADLDASSARPLNETTQRSHHVLPLEIEHRLANDFAFIAATQEAVFSVTASCVEERSSPSGHLEALTLRLAANEGISEALKTRLLEIWDLLISRHADPSQIIASRVFEKIIYLNRTRILQRARKAVGHPPIFREKGRVRTNPDDKLLRAFARMRKEKLTPIGHAFVGHATALNTQLLHLLETVSVDEVEAASPEVLAKLYAISRQCFDVATSCGDGTRLPFKHLLSAAGLDQRTWLKNKHVVEIDKIGAYWRIARSLVHIHRQITATNGPNTPPIRLLVEGIQPYTSVTLSPSIQGRPMACYVHAEVQLLAHYLLQPQDSPHQQPVPRIIGASKSACFLCFLFIRAHGGLRPPATHGRLYDQWTIPDLEEYTAAQVDALRHAIGLMAAEMAKLRETYCLKRPRDHPMTSRVDLETLSVFTDDALDIAAECEGAPGDGTRTKRVDSVSAATAAADEHRRLSRGRPRSPTFSEKDLPSGRHERHPGSPACLDMVWPRLRRWLHIIDNRKPS